MNEKLTSSQLPSGFSPVESANGPAPTDLPGDASDKSLAPSQSDIPPTVRRAFVQSTLSYLIPRTLRPPLLQHLSMAQRQPRSPGNT